jgi:hypothetical protein
VKFSRDGFSTIRANGDIVVQTQAIQEVLKDSNLYIECDSTFLMSEEDPLKYTKHVLLSRIKSDGFSE